MCCSIHREKKVIYMVLFCMEIILFNPFEPFFGVCASSPSNFYIEKIGDLLLGIICDNRFWVLFVLVSVWWFARKPKNRRTMEIPSFTRRYQQSITVFPPLYIPVSISFYPFTFNWKLTQHLIRDTKSTLQLK